MKNLLTPAQSRILDDVAFTVGVEPRAYSGRHMYGAECFAITGDLSGLTEFIYRLTMEEPELAQLFMANGISEDSLGMSNVYYWPNIHYHPYPEESE